MNCYNVILKRTEQKIESVFAENRQAALTELQVKYQDTPFLMTSVNGSPIIGACSTCRKWCTQGDKVHGIHGSWQFVCEACFKPDDAEFQRTFGTTDGGKLYVKAEGKPVESHD